MNKKLIFIHGRATKPLEDDLRELWYESVKSGLKRDYGESAVQKFESMDKEFVYYGDISNDFLHKKRGHPIPDNIETRKAALEKLKSFSADQFSKAEYKKIRQLNPLKELLADAFSGITRLLRIGNKLVSLIAPDMAEYWNREAYFGSDVRWRLTPVLEQAFVEKKQIMLVAHSLGTIISYDTLWKFSHYSEYRSKFNNGEKLDLFVTMGSPLADENIKSQIKGMRSKGTFRYPNNIKNWINISAEDDYISHDSRLSNDFRKIHKLGLMENPIKDIYPIYNLTVRNNKSNPHSSIGYLIHPAFTKIIHDWMQ